MLIGPVFTREALLAPRRTSLYVARAAYAGSLFLLIATAWLLLAGTQIVQSLGDLARFGGLLFQILVPLQLAVAIFASALTAASGVAQEKDRRTFVLLLITSLTNRELVLGKLLACLLQVGVLLLAGLPVFMLTALLGGVDFAQILKVWVVTLLSAMVAGSLGSTIALWRDTTFQSLAYTIIAIVCWILAGELLLQWGAVSPWCAEWGLLVNPFRAVVNAAHPLLAGSPHALEQANPFIRFVTLAGSMIVIINGLAIALVRYWNPSRAARHGSAGLEEGTWDTPQAMLKARSAAHAAPGKVRPVWDNPVLWREIRTWAYGRKTLIIRLVYLAFCGLAAYVLWQHAHSAQGITRSVATATLAPLFVASLTLINAQAVTSLTTERDLGALDLLLVTDLSAKEFIFGKLLGGLYNAKEMVLAPLVLAVVLWRWQAVTGENLFYLALGYLVMVAFSVMLGVHAGITYLRSRAAIGTSLATLFFLCLGVATCMRMMIAFSGAFHFQLAPFFVLSVGGGVGLYLALGHRNPSPAIGLASFACPSATFYAITSYLQYANLGTLLVVVVSYGFATAAMMVPAIYEFDLATGRTTLGDS